MNILGKLAVLFGFVRMCDCHGDMHLRRDVRTVDFEIVCS